MSTLTVARKDFQDAIRSWLLLGLTAVFVVFAAGAAYIYIALGAFVGGPATGESISSTALISFLSALTAFFIPLIGLIVGYKSIIAERESGSIALLLSLPHTRRDVVLGKVLGRTGVVFVSAVVGFLIAAGVVVVLAGSLSAADYALFVLATLLLALAFVALAVSFSAATKSSTLSLVGAGILTVLFIVPIPLLGSLWALIPTLVRFVLDEYTPLTLDLSTQPEWAQFFIQLDPTVAYSDVLGVLIPDLANGGGGAPFYLAPSFGFVILAAWIVVPLALGYYRFDATDL